MNQDERNQQHYDTIRDAVIKSAMISNADSCFSDIPPEEEIRQFHSFSPEFLQAMDGILYKNQTPKRKFAHLARTETERSVEEPDQSFWEEWKRQHPPADDPSANRRSRKLRPSAKAAIAAAAVLAVVVGGIHLSDNGFLRASLTQNVVEDGQSVLLTDMMDGDFELVFRAPAFVPKGYKVLSDRQSDFMRILEYSNGVKILTIKYDVLSNTDTSLDNERHLKEEKSIQLKEKYDALLSFSGQTDAYTILTWQDGLIKYRILGFESEEILIKIAESIMP